MEDDWQAKLPPPWPPPPPAGTSSTPPPPPLPLPTSGSGSQIPIQSRQRIHSLFAQEATLQGCTMLQEPFGFSPSNLSSCRSGKPDMSNPILALLSGRSLQPPSNFSQLSNSAPAPSDLPSHSSSVTCGVSVTGLATSSRSHGNDTLGNGELSVGTSQSMLISMGTRNPISWNNVPVVTSPPHSTDVAKLLLHEAVQANGNGMTVLSPRHEWQNSIKLVNGSHLQSPTHLTLPQALEVKSSISGYASALYNGHPRVFCLSTVGELFVSDMGFLGVLCLCHGMRMSVAKFCEHSGAYSVSPGNAARLENGLTIAQWCKLNFGSSMPNAHCLGFARVLDDGEPMIQTLVMFGVHEKIRVPDDYNGWDWPDSFLPKLCPAGSKANSFPLLLKNHVAPQSEAFSGFRQYGESCGNSVMVNQSSTGTGDQLAFEKSANNDVNSTHQGNNPARSNCYFKGFSDAGQSSVPAVAKSRAVLAAKETPVWINRAAPGLPIYVEELSRGPQSVAGKTSSGIHEAPPILHASKISSKDFKVGRGNNLSEGYPGDRHAVPSNIELRLGQPSQHKQTCAGLKQTCSGLVPASLCPNQPGVLCNFEKAELLQPLTALCSKEINEFRPIWSTSEILPSNRRLLQDATGKADTPGDSEADPMDNATKNSAISLFLSHLNYTEGNKTSLTTIDAADESEHCMTAVFDSDSLGTRCNLSEYVKNIDDVTEGKSNINGLDPFNHGEKGKAQRVDKDCCCNPLGCISVLDKKLGIDSGAVSELFCHKCSYTCDSRSSLSMLQIAPNMRKSRHSEKVSFKEIKNGHGNHFSHRPQNAAPCATMESSPNLQTAASISATKPLYTLEKSAPPAIKQYPNVTQYSSDDCSIHHASRHKAKVSKVELSNGSAEPNNHGRSCCPSALGLQRNDNKEDMVIPEKLRQLSCCSIHQDRFHHFRFFHPCSNGCHGDGFDILTGNDPSLDKCCSCSTLKQRIPLYCKDHHSHFPTSYPCGSDEQALLRYGRTSNSSSAENAKHGICSQKEHRCCLSGQCSCKFPSNCFTGPCFSRDYKFYAPSEPFVCEKAKERTAHGAYDYDRVSECGKRLMENHCECCRKQVFMKNDCQTGFWRDVPDKLIDHTTAIVQEKHAYKFESQELIGRQQTDTMKEIDGPDLETMPMKEQQVSNVCSGYSAPVLTEFSIGINNIDSCATDVCNAKFLDDSVVDEESGIEKCGSSDDPLDNRQIKDFSTKINTFKNPVKSRLRYPPAEDHVSVSSSVLEEVRNENGDLKENVKKLQRPERTDKTRKRKGPIKWRRLNSYLPLSGLSASHSYVPGHGDHLEVQLSSSKENEAPLEPDSDMQKTCILSCRSTIKRKRSTLSSIKSLCWKRSKVDHLNDKPQSCSDGSNPEVSNSSDGTGIKDIQALAEGEEDHLDNETPPRYISLGGMSNSRNPGKISSSEKRKPVVCGNLGIISDGLDGPQKPAKILSLRLIMKNAKKIRPTKREGKVRNLSISHSKKSCQSSSARSSNELLCEKEQLNGNLCRGMKNSMFYRVKREGLEPSGLRSATDKDRSSKNHGCGVELSMVKRETKCGSSRPAMVDTCHQGLNPPQRSMETRKRSLSRLMGGEEHTSSCSPSLGKNECSNLNETGDGQLYKRLGSKKILRGALARKIKWLGNSQDFQEHAVEHYSVSTRRSSKMQTSQPFFPDSDAFCCVCGSSNKDEVNHLLQCSRCFIRVHQACYGVSKVPKGHWYCRPCKSNAKNTVCVLCGYDGGAMTRAVKCRNIVKNLLKVWGVGPEFKSVQTITSIMTSKNKLVEPTSVGEGPSHVESDSGPDTGPASSEATYSVTALDIGLQNQDIATQNIDSPQNNFLVNNTVVAGVIDPSTTQWIHMVCGLWTPGTRCPNVDTMNAFDVSGASPARKNIVCSICNRPGGACIRCRVINCSVHFHPWCAHQKGLLQSEIEGADNEKVGFYGRCSLHATYQSHHIDVSSLEPGVESPRNHEFSCARTQGYRGQKREERFNNFMKPYSDGRVCVVSQEQINAWIHINGQKSLFRSPVKAPSSNVDNDFRKEYIRYKQTKAWKQLVVYKSGIHALGLYTSQFIARGAMVVEYVGEIVGLRVADRREIEYQSGRKLQYKSACYFFRIDKEHIIDATRKGGIARFVNHSCLPNCVAKIISVRNEKKVVFFAERDINPGEEITYDYHFNHEDEGKKIPCFCNSKNCRRYLN